MRDKINGNKCANVSKRKSEKCCVINGNHYIVTVNYSEKSKDTVKKKIENLIVNELSKEY